jgi:hypothetical protein
MFETYMAPPPELRGPAVGACPDMAAGKEQRCKLGMHLARMLRRARRQAAAGVAGPLCWFARQPLSAAYLCDRMLELMPGRQYQADEQETVRGL